MSPPATLEGVLSRAGEGRHEPLHRAVPWVVYGCGSAGRSWARTLVDAGFEVRGFVDRHTTDPQSFPVMRPDDCPDAWKAECSLLLGLHNPAVDVGAIRSEMEAMGFGRIRLLQELIDEFPERSHFWLAPASESLGDTEGIRAAHAALTDEHSRGLFVALLDQRLNAVAGGLPAPDPAHVYLPPDLPPPGEPLRFVDCGAYTGDTIDHLRRLGHRFAEIAAFEPDPAHYQKLASALASERASVFPCGAWSRTEQLRFASNDAASRITGDGDIVIHAVALDDALPGFAPNFIKMDIEGAEGQALEGARRTICAHRPRLAISAYHRPRDLWELLLQVHGWDLGYSFHLRSHSYNGFDTVLYALPEP